MKVRNVNESEEITTQPKLKAMPSKNSNGSNIRGRHRTNIIDLGIPPCLRSVTPIVRTGIPKTVASSLFFKHGGRRYDPIGVNVV